MSRRTTTSVVALSCAAGLSLAGCSGDDAVQPTPSQTSGNATVTATPRASQPAGAIKELSGINCRQGSGGWTFRATLKNSGTETMVYTVMVAVAKKDGGTVLGSKEFTETVKAGESTALSAENFYKGSEKDVLCVPSATKAKPS